MSVVGKNTSVRARVDHTCWWCGEPIRTGDVYVRWAWADGGVMSTVKCHPECSRAWDMLSCMDAEEVYFASYDRGCVCPNGNCSCDKG